MEKPNKSVTQNPLNTKIHFQRNNFKLVRNFDHSTVHYDMSHSLSLLI